MRHETYAPTRRDLLSQFGFGVGAMGLASLLSQEAVAAPSKPGENLPLSLSPRLGHHAPRATAMISLFMHGGPSHVDLLDPKPNLSKLSGTDYQGDIHFSFVNRASKKLFGTPWKFRKHGQSGTEISELLPYTARVADDICVIRSMQTGHNGHEVSIRYFHGGIAGVTGRPTLGSWMVYGLGSESRDLPAYLVLSDPGGHPVDGTHNWSSGFMPSLYQGTVLRPKEPRIPFLDRPAGLSTAVQRRNLGLLAEMNKRHAADYPAEPDLDSRIASYELAARMQLSASDALDVSRETAEVHRLYGLDNDATREYGTRCLIARRLVERGVRFVQMFLGGQPWDNHTTIKDGLPAICKRTDQPAAALVTDLKRLGMLDTTLVHWGGEIGRLPVCEGALDANAGRDHNGQGFSIWMAGGGIKGGMTYGNTDDVGHRAVDKVVNPNDFQATVLHLMGINHERLEYHANGRVARLIDGKKARVVQEILC
jgi:hypothetical protein